MPIDRREGVGVENKGRSGSIRIRTTANEPGERRRRSRSGFSPLRRERGARGGDGVDKGRLGKDALGGGKVVGRGGREG